MKKFTTDSVRKKFIDYFVSKGHEKVAASPLIPHNDPTLMFVNSGMVQFKDVFTGREERSYKRATTAQKSVRAGGKHNDLENVGYTARHHTFFEMLGNFSFGDYFKEEAIYYAWELLTKEFGIPKDKLYATIYHTDEEAAGFWKKIASMPEDRVIRIKTDDNFWSMGDTGPCGPCSEIFYDHGPEVNGGLPGTPDQDGDRYIEIWNMVFMQFEQIKPGERIDLPKKSVDTGMGLERTAAVLQGVRDNYEIDLFKELISYAQSLVGTKAEGEALFSYRVIADHIRSCAFLIADGVVPSGEGRGYVLRRIARRAMRHAAHLGSREPLMSRLVPKLVDLMSDTYPELRTAKDFVEEILFREETSFKTTLERGLKLLDQEIPSVKNNKLSGEVAFKLYDTYGFPLDLTQDILKKNSISVDESEFDRLMSEQKERAKKAWKGSGESKEDDIWFDIKSEFGSTEFLGYKTCSAEAKILALVRNGKRIDSVQGDEPFFLIASQTPFYGESGGQIGDVGTIKGEGLEVKVIDTLKFASSLHAHRCLVEKGICRAGAVIKLTIDNEYRNDVRAHHSATHLLHAALRESVGPGLTQKGSLVARDRLRFDVSSPAPLGKEILEAAEDRVNRLIRENSEVRTKIMPLEEAAREGAMALFGEKYDSEVRTVSMGGKITGGNEYSYELCGGTHVSRTGDIGFFKIISESALASGVRRIEALCGDFALKYVRENENLLTEISSSLKCAKNDAKERIGSLLSYKKETERELEKIKAESLNFTKEIFDREVLKKDDKILFFKILDNFDVKIIRSAAENLAKKYPSSVIILASRSGGKISASIASGSEAAKKNKASDIAKKLSSLLGGSGGGGSDFLAQAGGPDGSDLAKLGSIILEGLN